MDEVLLHDMALRNSNNNFALYQESSHLNRVQETNKCTQTNQGL